MGGGAQVHQMLQGITIVPPMVLTGEPGSEMRGNPRQQNQVRSWSESRGGQKHERMAEL